MKTKTDMEIIHIEKRNQIIEKLSSDGDQREDNQGELECFEVYEGDDLGFYQQACEFLLLNLASDGLSNKIYIETLEKRVAELLEQRDQISARRNELVGLYENLRVENQKLNKKGE